MQFVSLVCSLKTLITIFISTIKRVFYALKCIGSCAGQHVAFSRISMGSFGYLQANACFQNANFLVYLEQSCLPSLRLGDDALAKLIIIYKTHTHSLTYIFTKFRAKIKFYHEVFIRMLGHGCACFHNLNHNNNPVRLIVSKAIESSASIELIMHFTCGLLALMLPLP